MKHFQDPALEEIGLRMEFRVFQLLCAISLEPQTGFDWELSEAEIEPIRKELWMNNIEYAKKFYSENLTDLKMLKYKVGKNDPKFLEFSSVISHHIHNILKLGVGLAINFSNVSDFKEHLKSPEYIKIKNNLTEGAVLLIKAKKDFYMDSVIKGKIDNLINTIFELNKKYNISRYKFW